MFNLSRQVKIFKEDLTRQLIDQYTKYNFGPMIASLSGVETHNANISLSNSLYNQIIDAQLDGGFELALLQLLYKIEQVIV